MSFQDILAGPECNVDVYEQPDEDKWVECKIRKNKIGLIIAIPIIVVIMIIFLFVGSTGAKVIVVTIGCVLIPLLLLSHFYWTPLAARNEHRTTQLELKSRIDSGMSRAQAMESIQHEKLKKMEIQSHADVTRSAAHIQSSGMYAIANAMRGRSV